jgi:hypothetical protein
MQSGGGKRKGARQEREVCRELSLWATNGERTDVFWRSSQSGGRATTHLKVGRKLLTQAGDVSAIDPIGVMLLRLVIIEIKHYRDLQIHQGFLQDTGNLYSFWLKLREQCKHYTRAPLLIGRQNNQPAFCLISAELMPVFGLCDDHCVCIIPRWNCSMVLFERFLEQAKYPTVDALLPLKPHRIRLGA